MQKNAIQSAIDRIKDFDSTKLKSESQNIGDGIIVQLFFSATSGLPLVKYGDKKGAKYQNQPNEPISSKNHLNK